MIFRIIKKKNLEFVEYMLHDSPYQNQQNDLDLYSASAKYYLRTAKMTGFGGTLDNENTTEQTSSCMVKEAMMKVRFAL